MITLHILTRGFLSGNGQAFLFPIIFHREALHAAGVRYRIFEEARPELADCDVLIIESKFYRDAWAHGEAPILEEIDSLRGRVGRLLWFDTTDSTGTLQTAVFPLVNRYYKNLVLKDRSLYKKALYGRRLFTEFYHLRYGVVDEQPDISKPITDSDVAKLAVSWNPGLADYSFWRPFRAKLFQLFGWKSILQHPRRWVPPAADRPIGIRSRFSTSQRKATVRFHRQRVRDILGEQFGTDRIGRRAYFKELKNTKAVISPFSYSELSFRDFEVFLSGCLLIKPNMSHLDTWPDLYQDGITYAACDWTMEDLPTLLERVGANYEEYLDIARAGQANYRKALVGDQARDAFVTRFAGIVQDS